MKNTILLFAIFCSCIFMQANNSTEPVYKAEGNLVSVTTFHENGNVKETGYYKNKKLHGQWNLFNKDGIKITSAEYANGKKVGKWMFLNEGVLTEVNYENCKIASIHKWNTESIALE